MPPDRMINVLGMRFRRFRHALPLLFAESIACDVEAHDLREGLVLLAESFAF